MSSSNQQPEPDSFEARRRVAREAAACGREKEIAASGSEPVSVWVFAACGAAVVAAGAILGGAGKHFDYGKLFREGYVRSAPPGGGDEGPPPKAAMDAYMARGKKVWATKCVTCHGPEGKGQGELYPTLVGSQWALGETDRFAMIVLNGLVGPISTGKTYGGAAGMPSQNDATAPLSPEDLAGVMTYVRNNFGNTKGDVVTVEMAKNAFAISAKRANAGKQTTAAELTAEHAKDLPGKPQDPKGMVNPLTLMPVFDVKKADAPASAPPAPAP
jgi:mono/diheme cytochrome c family protein